MVAVPRPVPDQTTRRRKKGMEVRGAYSKLHAEHSEMTPQMQDAVVELWRADGYAGDFDWENAISKVNMASHPDAQPVATAPTTFTQEEQDKFNSGAQEIQPEPFEQTVEKITKVMDDLHKGVAAEKEQFEKTFSDNIKKVTNDLHSGVVTDHNAVPEQKTVTGRGKFSPDDHPMPETGKGGTIMNVDPTLPPDPQVAFDIAPAEPRKKFSPDDYPMPETGKGGTVMTIDRPKDTANTKGGKIIKLLSRIPGFILGALILLGLGAGLYGITHASAAMGAAGALSVLTGISVLVAINL
jgi:hypothetical protein